jgi:hypothetical protein
MSSGSGSSSGCSPCAAIAAESGAGDSTEDAGVGRVSCKGSGSSWRSFAGIAGESGGGDRLPKASCSSCSCRSRAAAAARSGVGDRGGGVCGDGEPGVEDSSGVMAISEAAWGELAAVPSISGEGAFIGCLPLSASSPSRGSGLACAAIVAPGLGDRIWGDGGQEDEYSSDRMEGSEAEAGSEVGSEAVDEKPAGISSGSEGWGACSKTSHPGPETPLALGEFSIGRGRLGTISTMDSEVIGSGASTARSTARTASEAGSGLSSIEASDKGAHASSTLTYPTLSESDSQAADASVSSLLSASTASETRSASSRVGGSPLVSTERRGSISTAKSVTPKRTADPMMAL